MAKQYNTDDILNSISWQLKRIADSLEKIADTTTQDTTTQDTTTQDTTRLRAFLRGTGNGE